MKQNISIQNQSNNCLNFSIMKTVYLLFPLFFLSPVILLPCSASPNSQLSLPAAIRNTDKQSPELLQLKKLLDDGDIIPFYQAADKMLKEARRYHKKTLLPENWLTGFFCATWLPRPHSSTSIKAATSNGLPITTTLITKWRNSCPEAFRLQR